MPIVRRRRRVYFDYSYSRRMRMEAWLSISIYVAAGIFLLSLMVCLPDILSVLGSWFLPHELSFPLNGGYSGAEQSSLITTTCWVLMAFSGAYLIPALFIRFHTRR